MEMAGVYFRMFTWLQQRPVELGKRTGHSPFYLGDGYAGAWMEVDDGIWALTH